MPWVQRAILDSRISGLSNASGYHIYLRRYDHKRGRRRVFEHDKESDCETMILFSPPVRPDEIRPFDVAFDVPDGTTISNIAKTLYVRTDNSKTDVSSTKIAGTGIAGKYARIVFQSLSLGVYYHLKVEAELASGQTLIERWIIPCQKEQLKVETLPAGGRRSYWIDFSKKLPGVNINTATTTFTAYDQSDTAQTDISETLIAGYAASGQILQIDCENGEANKTYIINVLAGSLTDSVTSMGYKVGITLVIECKEF